MPHASVLLVDDVPEVVESLYEALLIDGFRVRTATSGDQALALIEEDQPDVVVSDLEMPGMDGYELARRIRSLYVNDVLLVALSGSLPGGSSSTEGRLGFDFLFGKPVALGDLEAVLDRPH